MRHADSDSVNLGSNPSPPATEILEKSGDLATGQVGQDSHDRLTGRTQPGTGDTFGRLTLAEPVSRDGRVYWLCRCECGQHATVREQKLMRGHTRSCGCLKRELIGNRRRTHGQSHTQVYRVWQRMIRRCENPDDQDYSYYGGRGIRVCERWRASFADFLKDMGSRPPGKTIDRVNNDGDYEPGNCRWATRYEQTHNRRSSKQVVASQIRQTHEMLDALEVRHQGREDVAGRVRILRHSLRLMAGGDLSAEIRAAVGATVSDLHHVTARSSTVHARAEP
jgi:hypothetical protein